MVESHRGSAAAVAHRTHAPRVLVSGDGRFAVVIEPASARVVRLVDGDTIAVYALADGAQVAWLGTPSRLVVISPGPGYQAAQLIDPELPEAEPGDGEGRVESTMRLAAMTDTHALFVGASGVMLLHATGTKLTPSRFLTLKLPTVAGSAGRRFVVAIDGTIEEWDPKLRSATRRLRLRIPVHDAITALGGSERQFWMITREMPSRIAVIVHVNRGQPSAHELPEPIESVTSHPQSDLLACIGRDTGRLYVLSLDGGLAARSVAIHGLDAVDSVAFCPGHAIAMVVARAGKPLMVVGLDGRPIVAAPRARADAAEVAPARPLEAAGPMRAPVRVVDAALSRAVERVAWERQALSKPAVEEPEAIPHAAEHVASEPEPTPPAPGLVALGARASVPRCSSSEYDALLEHLRRVVIAVTQRAIARDRHGGLSVEVPDPTADHASDPALDQALDAALHQALGRAVDEAKERLRVARAELTPRQTPLDLLCREYGLDAVEEQILIHLAAPSLWGELARLYVDLANDPNRASCDEHLLWQLLGGTISRRELVRALDPDAPLLRHGLVRATERARPFQALAADPIAVKLLGGHDLDGGQGGLGGGERGLERVELDVPLDRVVAPPGAIERALAELAAARDRLGRIVVRGRPGAGRRTLLAALARLAERSLAMIDLAPLVRDNRLGELATLLQHADLCGWLPCVDGVDAIAHGDAAARSRLHDIIRDHHGPVAVRLPHHMPVPLDPDHVLVDLPTLSAAERAEQWRAALSAHELAVRDPDVLAARFIVGTGTIRRVAAAASHRRAADADHAVEAAMSQHLESMLGAAATRVTPLADWSRVVLQRDVLDSITELVARIRHRHSVFEAWGFDRSMSAMRGVIALFEGAPGTGKTLVAGAIARDLGVDLYRIELARLLSTWSGETEQQLGNVFDAAEAEQVVIVVEDTDVLFARPTSASGERDARSAVEYLVRCLDSFEGVVVLTANAGTVVDGALKRRLSARVTFPFPDETTRERLWRVHLPDDLPVSADLDLDGLARQYPITGGHIRNAVWRAACLAADQGSPLSQEHLERALRTELRESAPVVPMGVRD